MSRYRLTIAFVITALVSIAVASLIVGNVIQKDAEANL